MYSRNPRWEVRGATAKAGRPWRIRMIFRELSSVTALSATGANRLIRNRTRPATRTSPVGSDLSIGGIVGRSVNYLPPVTIANQQHHRRAVRFHVRGAEKTHPQYVDAPPLALF